MKKGIALMIVLMLTAAALAGCAAIGETANQAGLQIVATNFPCYDFARAVAGDRAQVTMLLKPGSEVHSYEPAPSDVVAVMDADLFLYIGGESDSWVEEILDSMGQEASETLRMMECVEILAEEDVAEMEGGQEAHNHAHAAETEYDEHIWTSPVNAMEMVQAVVEKLCAVDPAGAEIYRANGEDYIAQIRGLDEEFAEAVANGKRKELVFGDRFPFLYFARRYGLTCYAAFPGCAEETEPSAKTMLFLMDKVTGDGIPAVYTIELSTGNVARALAEETGAEVLQLHSMQNVTAEEFSGGETYVSLMQKNLEALKEGLK